jgi:hypothetical protein
MRRKSIDEQLVEAERADRLRREDTNKRIISKLEGITLILESARASPSHVASQKLKEAILILSETL